MVRLASSDSLIVGQLKHMTINTIPAKSELPRPMGVKMGEVTVLVGKFSSSVRY